MANGARKLSARGFVLAAVLMVGMGSALAFLNIGGTTATGTVSCAMNGATLEITMTAGSFVELYQSAAGANLQVDQTNDSTNNGSATCGGDVATLTTVATTGVVDGIRIIGQNNSAETVVL